MTLWGFLGGKGGGGATVWGQSYGSFKMSFHDNLQVDLAFEKKKTEKLSDRGC